MKRALHPSAPGARPPSQEIDAELALLVEELTSRLQRGEAYDEESVLRRHPQHAEALVELFPAIRALAKLNESLGRPGATGAEHGLSGTLGDFRLLHEVGRGGMGVVYAAEQLSLGRRVALKVLPLAATMDPRHLRRFQNEARAAASLHHPNIVPVYAVGCDRGLHFYAMQFIDGRTLAQLIHELSPAPVKSPPSPRSPSDTTPAAAADGTVASGAQDELVESLRTQRRFRAIARLGVQAAEALEHAHAIGIVHRDIKPGNLMLEGGKLWVTDFGLAHTASDASLTMSGDMLGTLRYMSPEQALAKHGLVDHRTDIYSLGATLYELLTGRPAIEGKDRGEMLRRIAFEEPPAPRRLDASMPRELETVVLKAMSKEPQLRYQSAEELAEDLRRFAADRPIRSRRTTRWQLLARWGRRNPAVATALAVTTLVVLVANLLVTWKWREERRAVSVANQRADELARSMYAQLVGRAELERSANNVSRAEQLLDGAAAELRRWEWGYLKRLVHPELLTLPGHTGAVRSVAYSPDGLRVASGGADGVVRIWDIDAGRETRRLEGHTTTVASVAFSPDGRRLVSAACSYAESVPGEVIVWDLDSGRELANWPQSALVTGVAWSPRGALVALACWDRTVRLVDTESQETRQLRGHNSVVKCVAFSPDGAELASGDHDGRIKLWNVASGAQLRTMTGHASDILSVAYSPDGSQLASASWDHTVRVWEVVSGLHLRTLTGHEEIVREVAFSADDELIATASDDGTVRLWSTHSWALVHIYRGHDGAATAVAFSPSGNTLVSGGLNGELKLWNGVDGPEGVEFDIPDSAGAHVAIRPDGAVFAAALLPTPSHGNESALELRDSRTGEATRRLASRVGLIPAVVFASRGGRLLAAWDDEVRVWDSATAAPLPSLTGHAGIVRCLATIPGGAPAADDMVVSGGDDGTVRLWSLEGSVPPRVLHPGIGPVGAIAARADGTLVAAGEQGQLAIWEPAAGKRGDWSDRPGRRLRSAGAVRAIALAPQGPLAVACDSGVELWSLVTGERAQVLRAPSGAVVAVSYSPAGDRLAAGADDGAVVIYDVADGQEVLTLRRQLKRITSVSFTPDGLSLIAIGGQETSPGRIWDASPAPVDRWQAMRPEWHRLEAQGGEWHGIWRIALHHLDCLLRNDPRDLTLLSRRASAHAELGEREQALADLRRLVGAHESRLEARVAVGDPTGNEASPSQLTVDYLRDHWSLSVALLESGAEDEYRERCRRLAQRCGRLTDGELAGWACRSLRLLDDAELVELSRRIVDECPDEHPELLLARAIVRIRQGRPDEADALLDRAAQGRAFDVEPLYQVLALLGQRRPAGETFERVRQQAARERGRTAWQLRFESDRLLAECAAQLASSNIEELLERARVKQRAVITAMDAMVSRGDANANVYRQRGDAHAQLGHWPEAAEDFVRAAQLAPNELDLWCSWAESELASGDDEAFRRAASELLRRFGKTRIPGVASGLLYTLTLAPDPPEDHETLSRLAELGRQAFTGNERIAAAVAYRLGEYSQAARQFEACRHPRRAWDHCFLALCYAQLLEADRAAQCLERAEAWIFSADRADREFGISRWLNWQERVEALRLHDEAERLLHELYQAAPAR